MLAAVGGHLDYCDPDLYPVAHGTPLENAKERLPTIRADRIAYRAILASEGIAPGAALTNRQLVAVDEDYKQIQVIELTRHGDAYAFTVYVPTNDYPAYNASISGTVSWSGQVALRPRGPGKATQCPICLALGVRIATPFGPVPVQDLRVGMTVWSTDRSGRRIRAVVLETGRMEAPIGHVVVSLSLADGRRVVASPCHPAADGRTIGGLRVGDPVDGSVVASVTILPYANGFTFDLLPSGPTGTYFADGILLRSTLARTVTPAVATRRLG